MSYLGIFDQKCLISVILGKNFKNTFVIFEISTLIFVENESLTHTVNFGLGYAFSERRGPLYKACHKFNFNNHLQKILKKANQKVQVLAIHKHSQKDSPTEFLLYITI